MAGPVRIAILANGAQARNEMTRTGAVMSKLGGVAKLGALAGAAGLVMMAKSAISLEAQFSTSMRLIQAATGAPAAEMEKLNDLAIRLGAETAFSASDAADAMLELAKAGIDTKTIMGGGLSGTLTLAAAGGVELGTAATIASNALNTFNLRGQDMAKVAAALAGGANASSASVESLGQGLQQVGPGATNAGLSLQETVAALSAFDAAGVKGSDAGTSLKTMLARLVPQTDKASGAMADANLHFTDAHGNFVSLANMAGQLKRGLGGLSDAERTTALNAIFGSDASRAATVLMKEGTAGVRDYIKATNDQGAAQKMANARMGGTAGAMERLSGSVETAQLRLGQELAPAVEATANFFAEKLPPAMESAISVTKEFGHALEPVIPPLKQLGEVAADVGGFIADLPDPIKSIGIQAGIAALVLPRLTGAVTSATGAVTLNIAKLKQLNAEMSYAATRTQRVSALTSRLGGAAKTAAGVGGMLALSQGVGKADTAMGAFETTAGAAMLGFSVGGPWGAAIGAGAGGLFSLFKAIDHSSDSASRATPVIDKYADSIDAIAKASGRAQRAEALTLLQREKDLIPTANSVGIATSDMISMLLGSEKAAKRVGAAFKANGRTNVAQGVEIQRVTSFLREQGFALDLHRNELKAEREALKGTDREFAKVPNSVKRVNASLRDVGHTGSGMDKFRALMVGDLDKARSESDERARKINALLLNTTSHARPNLAPFRSDLLAQISAAGSSASSAASRVGANIAQGLAGGIANNAWQAVNAAGAMVTQAIQEANKKADNNSPSKKMRQVGDWMGQGLVEGLTRRERDAQEAGQRLVSAALVGSAGSRWGASAIEGRAAAQTAGAGRRRADSPLAHGSPVTIVIEGQPLTGIVRREQAADRRHQWRLDDRD